MTLWSFVALWIVVLTVFTFALSGFDKKAAIKGEWRVKESTLLKLSVIGGAVGLYLSMNLHRHKTKHTSFYIVSRLFSVIWLVVLTYAVIKILGGYMYV